MINMDEINEEIDKLEQCDRTTYPLCEKLAILYTVRNNFKGNQNGDMMRSQAAAAHPDKI